MDQIVVMGVAGCGKSTVGAELAARLGLPFLDGDTLHSPASVAKMAAGVPLDHDDRRPWLESVGRALADAPAPGIVVACSALTRRYRDQLRDSARHTRFVHLDGSPELLRARLQARAGHFMRAGMLDSQLALLERLDPDERGTVIDIDRDIDEIVDLAVPSL